MLWPLEVYVGIVPLLALMLLAASADAMNTDVEVVPLDISNRESLHEVSRERPGISNEHQGVVEIVEFVIDSRDR